MSAVVGRQRRKPFSQPLSVFTVVTHELNQKRKRQPSLFINLK